METSNIFCKREKDSLLQYRSGHHVFQLRLCISVWSHHALGDGARYPPHVQLCGIHVEWGLTYPACGFFEIKIPVT